MSPDVRTDVAASLLESQQIFNASLAGISDDEAARLPPSGGWPIVGIVEHLVITESNVPRFFSIGVKKNGARRDPARERELSAAVVNRSTKIAAPERVHPAGKFATLTQALAAFNNTRAETIRLGSEREGELDSAMVNHPLFGEVSMRQLLFLAAGHSTRHVGQIEEILRAVRA